jgi:glycosyltransferase involved in cell wall biosynthesis
MKRGLGSVMVTSRQSISGGTRLNRPLPLEQTNLPLVSIVTAVFNAEDCIANCIESVLCQDYPNIEHIILDGGSTDGTVDILRKYEDRVSLWISEPDSGIYGAWNKGLKLARGEWIAFLGADDKYLPGAISAYMNLAVQCPAAEFLSSQALLDHPSGHAPTFGGPWEWPRFSRAMTTIHVGTMQRRTLFERYGDFDASYRSAADYEFLLRAGDGLRAAFMPTTTVVMRAGGASDSTAGLYETRDVKVQRGVRSYRAATRDLRIAILRFHIRRLILALRSK